MADGDIVYSGSTFDVVEDWSLVRSRSRAERRFKRGHRQNIWLFEAGKDGKRKWPLHPLSRSHFIATRNGSVQIFITAKPLKRAA